MALTDPLAVDLRRGGSKQLGLHIIESFICYASQIRIKSFRDRHWHPSVRNFPQNKKVKSSEIRFCFFFDLFFTVILSWIFFFGGGGTIILRFLAEEHLRFCGDMSMMLGSAGGGGAGGEVEA